MLFTLPIFFLEQFQAFRSTGLIWQDKGLRLLTTKCSVIYPTCYIIGNNFTTKALTFALGVVVVSVSFNVPHPVLPYYYVSGFVSDSRTQHMSLEIYSIRHTYALVFDLRFNKEVYRSLSCKIKYIK